MGELRRDWLRGDWYEKLALVPKTRVPTDECPLNALPTPILYKREGHPVVLRSLWNDT